MINIVQGILLSPILIFIVLGVLFLALSRWALSRREVLGYALGWLIGVFFMIIYSSLTGGETVVDATAQDVQIGDDVLTFGQIIFASIFGLIVGAGSMFLIRLQANSQARRALVVALLTGLNLIVLFFVIISSSGTQRLIGISAMAFAITILFIVVLDRARTTAPVAEYSAQYGSQQAPPPDSTLLGDAPPASTRLDGIRQRVMNRRSRDQ